ncbi:MAG: sulfotransferase domain-containing protein [Chloroflexota bacterium]
MSHQRVPIPLAMKPITQFSRFLFRSGQGEWVFKLMGAASNGTVNAFKGYIPTKNDIIVACHSRSGSHWMLQIALQIANLGQADYDYLYDIVPWPDFLPGASIKLTETPPPSPTGLRVIKTHLPAKSVPVNDAAKYITVIRDPKEVLVSLYHFAPQAFAFMGIQPGTPEYWVEKFLKGQIPGGWWAEHMAGWWALRDKPNVYVIPFNALRADTSGEIDRIIKFLGVELSPDQRQQVIEKSSFEYMKAINHKFSPIVGDTDMVDIVRTGKTGTGSELFTKEQLARVDAYCKSELKRLGSDFPYDQLFA